MQLLQNVNYYCYLVTLSPYLTPNAEHCWRMDWYFVSVVRYYHRNFASAVISGYALLVNPAVISGFALLVNPTVISGYALLVNPTVISGYALLVNPDVYTPIRRGYRCARSFARVGTPPLGRHSGSSRPVRDLALHFVQTSSALSPRAPVRSPCTSCRPRSRPA